MRLLAVLLSVAVLGVRPAAAQSPGPPSPKQPPPATAAQPPPDRPTAPGQPAPAPSTPAQAAPAQPEVVPPADYVIGAEDVLNVVIWREKDLSAEVMVRPDGKVSLPLLNDIQAAGLTPEQFRLQVTAAVAKFVAEPAVSVIVRTINSRKVYIMGEVAKPGPYPLVGPVTVLQLIALSGGLTEFADAKGISVMRTENGRPKRLSFNYRDVSRGKKLEQNVLLRPGDTVIVP